VVKIPYFFITNPPVPLLRGGVQVLLFTALFYYKYHMEIQILTLLSPLCYSARERDPADYNPAYCNPFNYREGDGEKLYCFTLNEKDRSSFEPDKTALLGPVVFPANTLPEGKYLFAQKREILSREEIIDMAVEIQAEGLWRRLKPGETLYLRYLFEDSRPVTQLYRPYT
jgi:hypothetical protein